MTMWQNGSNPQPYTLAASCVAWTPGKILADGRATPCEAGDACDGIFNWTKDTGEGVGLCNPDGGGYAVMGLAHGAVTAGHKLVVAIGTDTFPKFADVDDAEVGDIIVGEARLSTSATEEDLADADGVFVPSLAVYIFPKSMQTAVEAP